MTPATNSSVTPKAAAYPPSWLDSFFEWVRAAPGPAWLFYVGLLGSLMLVFGALAWLDGVQPASVVLLIATDEATYIVYYLAVMHYLDSTAGRALAEFRPLLQAGDQEFARLRYELTTLPNRSTLVASSIGLLITLASLPFAPTNMPLGEIIRQPSTQVAFIIGNAILAIFVYHAVRQLRMVSRIHASVPRLDLFRRGPIYAFSRLTARTALGWVFGLLLGLSPRIAPFLTLENLTIVWLVLLPLAVLVFVLPLISAHWLLVREKGRLQDEVEQRVEAVLLRVHEQQDAGDLSHLGDVKTLLDTLLVEREMVARLPTWPWQPGTLAGFASALLLPLVLWFLQQLLTQWLPGV